MAPDRTQEQARLYGLRYRDKESANPGRTNLAERYGPRALAARNGFASVGMRKRLSNTKDRFRSTGSASVTPRRNDPPFPRSHTARASLEHNLDRRLARWQELERRQRHRPPDLASWPIEGRQPDR